jgi:hypothetical protein
MWEIMSQQKIKEKRKITKKESSNFDFALICKINQIE